jgi:hypothetical protein
MSENSFEEKEIIEEQTADEEANEEANEEITEENAVESCHNNELSDEESKPENSFIKKLGTAFIDELAIGLISIIVLYIIEGLLRVAGYSISEKTTMLFILFVVVSIIYRSAAGTERTIGKKLIG